MKKVYGLLVVLVLFVGCFLVATASENKQMELYRTYGNERIISARCELIGGKVVPKYIVTEKYIKIYESGKEIKKLGNKETYYCAVSDTCSYFAVANVANRNSRGDGISTNLQIYDAKGNLIWNKKTGTLLENFSLVDYKDSWNIFSGRSVLRENLEKTFSPDCNDIYEMKACLAGILILKCGEITENKSKKWILELLDFDGNFKWEKEISGDGNSWEPQLYVGNKNVFVTYPSNGSLSLGCYDYKGNLVGEYIETFDKKPYIFRVATEEDCFYFSKYNNLKQITQNSMKLKRELVFDSDIRGVYLDSDFVYLWRKDSITLNNLPNLSLDVIKRDFSKKATIKLDSNVDAAFWPKNISRIGEYLIVVQPKCIFVIDCNGKEVFK